MKEGMIMYLNMLVAEGTVAIYMSISEEMIFGRTTTSNELPSKYMDLGILGEFSDARQNLEI